MNMDEIKYFGLTFLIDMGGKMLQEFGRILYKNEKSVKYAFALETFSS
jgi:hypothetical protein